MEEKELIRLLRQYMPAEQALVGTPDPLHVIEARLTVSARKRRGGLHALRSSIRHSHAPLRQMAASIVLACFAAGFLWLDSGRRQQSTTNDPTGESLIATSIRTTTLSVISSTMLTSIPTLRN